MKQTYKIFDVVLSVVSLSFSVATIEEVLSIILLVLTIGNIIFKGVMTIIKAGKAGDAEEVSKALTETTEALKEVKDGIDNDKE